MFYCALKNTLIEQREPIAHNFKDIVDQRDLRHIDEKYVGAKKERKRAIFNQNRMHSYLSREYFVENIIIIIRRMNSRLISITNTHRAQLC